MSKRKVILRSCFVASSILLGALLTTTSIVSTPDNRAGINKALGQQDYEIVSGTGETDTEYFKSRFTNIPDLMDAGKALVEEIEGEGVTLLKNADNTLPLPAGSKISLCGIGGASPAYGGHGSAQIGGSTDPETTPTEGLENAKTKDGENANFQVNKTVTKYFGENASSYKETQTYEIKDAPWTTYETQNLVASIKEYNDAAVYTITRVSGEGSDLPMSGKYGDNLALASSEQSVLKGLKALKDAGEIKKIIVLLNVANPLANFLDDPEYGIDAALWIGTTGITGYKAIGNIFAGSVTPSGHLSDTFWNDHTLNPANKNFDAYIYENVADYDLPWEAGDVSPKYSTYDVYEEGVYLGYRYAETRYSDVVTDRAHAGTFNYKEAIGYPFGYGDSYTTFSHTNFNAVDNGENFTVTVDVKNTGDTFSGKDAVEIYVQKPFNERCITNGIEVPAVELIGFEKTKLLAPGETETVTVTIDKRDLTVYDANGAKTYILNDGKYYLADGLDSHNAMNNILTKQGWKTTDGLDEEGNAAMVKEFTFEYDATTYATSKATGKEITNLFDEADILKFEGASKKNEVTYLSRNDWEGTYPHSNAVLYMNGALEKALLEQNDGSLIPTSDTPYPRYSSGSGLNLIDLRADIEGNLIPYDDPKWEELLDCLSWEDTTYLLSNGFRLTAPCNTINKPGTVDHNGPAGLTESYGSGNGLAVKTYEKGDPMLSKRAPHYPCSGIIAATFNRELAGKFGDMLGEDGLWAGYNGFYGVAINTHRSPYEGRAYEYWSEDPFLCGTLAAVECEKMQAHGMIAYLKHFALNEQETCRQGVQIWANEQTLREIYLRPFEKAVVDGGALDVMTSFTRIGAKFVPASKSLMTDWLRGECGMNGLAVTDMYKQCYEPEHMPLLVYSGTNIPDGSVDTKVFNQYKPESGQYGNMAMAMREGVKHILYSTVRSNAMNGIGTDTQIVPITPAWLVTVYTLDGISIAFSVVTLGVALYFIIKDKRKRA